MEMLRFASNPEFPQEARAPIKQIRRANQMCFFMFISFFFRRPSCPEKEKGTTMPPKTKCIRFVKSANFAIGRLRDRDEIKSNLFFFDAKDARHVACISTQLAIVSRIVDVG